MCSVADFISGDHDLPICQEFDDDWEQDFLNGLSTSSKRPQTIETLEVEMKKQAVMMMMEKGVMMS